MYRIGLGLILPLMVPLFSYANEGAALPPLVDKPIKDPASFIQFALGDVCLPAAERSLSVSEYFELQGHSGALAETEVSDKLTQASGIKRAWGASSKAKTDLYENADGSCYIRSTSRKVEKRRAEILKFFATPESRFTSVYSGDNQPSTALRDIYCADLSDMGATIVTITTAKPERITKNTSTVQITTKNYSRSCTEAS